jgi:AAA family ATP:ADP antiporter
VRESFFLGEQGFERLPLAHLTVLVATLVTAQVYAAMTRRVRRGTLVVVANLVILATVLGFWSLLGPLGADKLLRQRLAFVYFCWVSVFSVFAVTLFWSLTHSLFTVEEGGRWYGWIGSGGILGAMTGGTLTQQLAERIGTENLLLVSAALLSPCLAIGWSLTRGEPGAGGASAVAGAPIPRTGALALFARSPYLSVLGAIVFLTIFVSVLDDYRYQQIIQEALPGQDARTAFYGSIYSLTNALGLVLSLVVAPLLLSRAGPRPGLLLYTLLVAGSAVWLWRDPGIEAVFWSAVGIQCVSYSLGQFSREVLYLPTSSEEKFVAKGFIDTFLFRLGAGAASVLILLAWPVDGVRTISYLTIPVAMGIAAAAVWISARHRERTAA